jgi:hypothetical protein
MGRPSPVDDERWREEAEGVVLGDDEWRYVTAAGSRGSCRSTASCGRSSNAGGRRGRSKWRTARRSCRPWCSGDGEPVVDFSRSAGRPRAKRRASPVGSSMTSAGRRAQHGPGRRAADRGDAHQWPPDGDRALRRGRVIRPHTSSAAAHCSAPPLRAVGKISQPSRCPDGERSVSCRSERPPSSRCSPPLVLSSPAMAQRWGRERFPRDGVCFFKD